MAYVEHTTQTQLSEFSGNFMDVVNEMRDDVAKHRLNLGTFMDSNTTVYSAEYTKGRYKGKYRIDCNDADEVITEYEDAGRTARYLQVQDNDENTPGRDSSKTYANVLYPVVSLAEIDANSSPYSVYDLIDAIGESLRSHSGQRIKL